MELQPTYKAFELDEIISLHKSKIPNWSDDAEITVRLTLDFNEEHIRVLTSHGFNRVSFGVQDFDPKVQEATHRVQPFNITKRAVDLAREYGIGSINTDFIYGLPYQSLETFKKTLDLSIELNPDRVAVFNYAHVPWLREL